jgi:putative glutamine amidotransferase
VAPPLIGLSTYVEQARYGTWDEPAALVPSSYVTAVTRTGGCPVLLPPSPRGLEEVLNVLDGLVVIGGPDVDPHLYRAQPHPETDPPRHERDTWEVALCHGALQRDLPLLAICRGLQVLNVALGGSLHQHLPKVVGSGTHRPEPGRVHANHMVLRPGSMVAAVLGPEASGLCHHHQAVDRLGQGLEAVGFADDGTLEAAEVPAARFAVGVQWHPEDNPSDDRLFAALARAAGHYKAHRQTDQGRTARAAPR